MGCCNFRKIRGSKSFQARSSLREQSLPSFLRRQTNRAEKPKTGFPTAVPRPPGPLSTFLAAFPLPQKAVGKARCGSELLGAAQSYGASILQPGWREPYEGRKAAAPLTRGSAHASALPIAGSSAWEHGVRGQQRKGRKRVLRSRKLTRTFRASRREPDPFSGAMSGCSKRCKHGLVKFARTLFKLVTGTLSKGKARSGRRGNGWRRRREGGKGASKPAFANRWVWGEEGSPPGPFGEGVALSRFAVPRKVLTVGGSLLGDRWGSGPSKHF